MKRISTRALVFALLFLVFLIGLVFLRVPFGAYPLMSVQDALDVLTPLVLLPIYYVLYGMVSKGSSREKGIVVFVLFAALWAAGQGMHLSANSISNLMEQNGAASGDIFKLTLFTMSI